MTWAANYIGSKPGPANSSLSPVVVGYVNQQGGTLSFPEATAAVNATVSFINAQLGGIDGHPLVVHQCLAAGTTDVQGCGTQMANDSAVKSLIVPLLLLNNQAFYNAIDAKKPIIDNDLIFPVDLTTPNVYSFGQGGSVSFVGLADFATKVLKLKTVAILRTDNPAGLAAAQAEAAVLKQFGATVTDVAVPEPGTAPEYTEAISQAGLQNGDGLDLALTSIGQSTAYDALQSLGLTGVDVLSSELALLPPMPGHLKSLGLSDTVFPNKWYMSDQGYSSAMPVANSDGANVFVAMMAQYAPNAPSIYGYAPTAFEELLEMAKFITEDGGPSATSAGIAAKIKAFTGPAVMAAGPAKCGAETSEPNLCVFDLGWEQRVNGTWVSVADGINGKAIDTLTP